MLKRLFIKNYAIIESVEIEFSDKLTIVTGETGAGKSIILGALGLIMGDRTETKVLYDDSKKCYVEAHFDILHYDLKELFEELDVDYDTEVIVRREITPKGKSRAFVNDTPIRLNELRTIASKLVDLHRQFDTLALQNEDFQREMIDALADNKALLNKYQKLYKSYQANQRKLDKWIEQNNKSQLELEFLEFQLEELSKAELTAEEQEGLEQELAQLTNAEDIKRILSSAYQILVENEQAISGNLREISNQIDGIKGYNKSLEKLYEKFNGLIYEIEDIGEEFNGIAEDTEYDEVRIQEVQERLDLIYRLQNKHQVVTIKELLDIQSNLEGRVAEVGDLSNQIELLEQEIDTQAIKLNEISEKLSKRRKAQAPEFEESIHNMLAQLSMRHAKIQVCIEPSEQLGSHGKDLVYYLFSANKGGRMDRIKNVASGGELSRLTLCTKSLVASAIPLPTMIFDEIDAGVSGDVAGKMGMILRLLSDDHQVITITHTPQIAAKADKHFFVYKDVLEEKTKTSVKLLDREERIKELAIMLSGNPPSDSAISNAIDLISK